MDTNSPKVTVSSAFYNTGPVILDMIKSVFAQTFTDWELLLIDDDEALANQIQRLVNDPLLVEHIVTQAYDLVMTHCHPELHTAGIEKIFHKITER